MEGQSIQSVEGGGTIALGHGGVVEDIVDEILHRSAIGQNGLADVNQLGGARSDDMDTQQRVRLAVKDHL